MILIFGGEGTKQPGILRSVIVNMGGEFCMQKGRCLLKEKMQLRLLSLVHLLGYLTHLTSSCGITIQLRSVEASLDQRCFRIACCIATLGGKQGEVNFKYKSSRPRRPDSFKIAVL